MLAVEGGRPMRNLRKFSSAFVLAVLVALVMSVGAASAEAAGKKPKPGICDYLQNIIDYPYTSPTVLAWALSLYHYYGCDAN
jgi:hypothetical protein